MTKGQGFACIGVSAALVFATASASYAGPPPESVTTESQIQELSGQLEVLKKRMAVGTRKQAEIARGNQDIAKQLAGIGQEVQTLNKEMQDAEVSIGGIREAVATANSNAARRAEEVDRLTTLATAAFCALTILLAGSALLAFRTFRRRDHAIGALQHSLRDTASSMAVLQEQLVSSNATATAALEAALSERSERTRSEQLATSVKEPSHALPLKVALELHRMRRRLVSMPRDIKGVGPLNKSLDRLQEQLQELGYELVDYTAVPFDDGMHVEARFVPDDNLRPGERVIAKTLRPQVNFGGALIQVAEVEVGLGG